MKKTAIAIVVLALFVIALAATAGMLAEQQQGAQHSSAMLAEQQQ
jgi:hypothetical protein